MNAHADFRVGHGYDAHRRAPAGDAAPDGRDLVLGGVRFADEPPLLGHSDADVVSHAVIDAFLSAAGLGDIGEMFPDTDPAHAGASSIELLRQCAAAVDSAGWRLLNADCTVVTDRPMLSPHKPKMQRLLSDAARGPVTVSGKRTEGLGALGRGEGVAAFAVALVGRCPDATGIDAEDGQR
ncbi:MAG TPA: 2-C-methyl-D-erythritol 2,4-cyclodiphosphate synthase [Acidimicrobiaceae bacterium]|nr:2-C-methyl-D-erythritol 2,4-cyclodiphosphate synthase [Acidimicrobiaceae bacterium]HCB37671.1 2-C-methyl-D-erythritol 2,4-cyclodiphosphate synthase [Acidimicrobiaceae bacterium]